MSVLQELVDVLPQHAKEIKNLIPIQKLTRIQAAPKQQTCFLVRNQLVSDNLCFDAIKIGITFVTPEDHNELLHYSRFVEDDITYTGKDCEGTIKKYLPFFLKVKIVPERNAFGWVFSPPAEIQGITVEVLCS
jgi:hypothetical protein